MLTIALPSKGRLKEETENYFKRIGLPIKTEGGAREYTGRFAGLDDNRVLFLQASEIARRLEDGSIDCGVTGLDLLQSAVQRMIYLHSVRWVLVLLIWFLLCLNLGLMYNLCLTLMILCSFLEKNIRCVFVLRRNLLI